MLLKVWFLGFLVWLTNAHAESTVMAADVTADGGELMRLQTMNLLATKERPELNPVLSALINEDVMKSIEAKRAIEQKELELIEAETKEAASTTESQVVYLTTTLSTATVSPNSVPTKNLPLDSDINVAFVDQSINLDAAGSESNKKSRIEIKKGPNGIDYEYEYVYEYDDEDDEQSAAAAAAEEKKDAQRGKSRYTNIDRSTVVPAENTLLSGKAKGRSTIVEDVEEGRLPANTRFPSRGKNVNDVPPTPSLDNVANNAGASSEKSQKKISVKRPSLELVDSQTFNTDEKQVNSPRNGDTEISAQETESAKSKLSSEGSNNAKGLSEIISSKTANVLVKTAEKDSEGDQTTPVMEKAAHDLYAILANENFNLDMTTNVDGALTTVIPDTTDSDSDIMTTMLDVQGERLATPSTTTTTTTTTTEAPTTKSTTTTTTTTTTVAPLYGGRRNGISTNGRNRFKLKSGAASATTTTTTESPSVEPASKGGKNRFQRPSFGNRNRGSSASTTTVAPASHEEAAVKEEAKPVSSPGGRGRTRNRFSIRSTTEKPVSHVASDENSDTAAVSSTTARSLRARPTLNLRGRSRTTVSTAKATTTADSSSAEDNHTSGGEEKSPPSSSLGRPSRFNINRASGNRLLPRARLNGNRGTTTSTEATIAEDSAVESSHHSDVKEASDDSSEEKSGEAATESPGPHHAGGGLTRLKSRPRLNIQQKTETPKPKTAPTQRKVNPLLARRKLTIGSSTTEGPVAAEETGTENTTDGVNPSSNEDTKRGNSSEDSDSAKDNTTEEAEVTTKPTARGLGLLGQRRRLPLRKPGTLL